MSDGRPSWVVVPAKDEAGHLPACLAALVAAAKEAPGPVRVILVDDGSTDGTRTIASDTFAMWSGADDAEAKITGRVVTGPAEGVGWARRAGFEAAVGEAHGIDSALIATTDADSQVDPGWFRSFHLHLDAGHLVIAGDVHLEPAADPRLIRARARRLASRLRALPPAEADAPHPHFAGSNLGFAREALAALGPLPTPSALEDRAILERCQALGLPVLRDGATIVVTSARTSGRAELGLAAALARDLHDLGQV